MKIGIAQLNPIVGDLIGNSEKILAAAQTCASERVDLFLTPELSLCGYPPRDLLMDRSFIDDMAIALQKLAQALPAKMAVLVGTVEPNPQATAFGGKPLFNSAVLIQNRQIVRKFHKRLLPTYDVFDEDRYFEPGEESNFFSLEASDSSSQTMRIGVTICEDFWNDEKFWGRRNYPENPVAELVAKDIDLLVNLSASPYAVGKQKIREAMIEHSAIEYGLPIIYVNQVGGNDDLIFDGSSVAFNHSGQLVGRAPAFKTDLLVLDFDLDKQDLLQGKITAQPQSDDAEIWDALVLGVRDYAQKCGFKKVVIGLSGGIDSALVAAIATEALGADNVLGVLMPSPYSSDHSITDALELAKNLEIDTQTLAIAEAMQTFDRILAPMFVGTAPDITEENLQSRIRGNLLMAISNKFGHLLLSTGNKSEMAVGYCTLYGDMNGGLAAISDVPKTRVYSLCQWLNATREHPIIPAHILTKAPSAELKPGQVDRDSLPPYDVLDDILQRSIGTHASPAEIIKAGHAPEVVEQVVKLVARAEFKRRQAAPGLKISDRAFGSGWRMPIASKRTRSSDFH
ncbi:NAD+ synthase [Pseudanabaena sp. PCC 6802]|uniref:NAD+ synthase n=1 Tax=Pseudanabaena sp. PCC 6802 TaxID=118173 RepID=UPI00034C476D|nr:NAD+ synthase [Pseudanabaena sp. PCC 6802]